MLKRAIPRLALILLVCGTVYAADPLVGVWKRNAARSKYSSGRPPEELTIVVTPATDSAYHFIVNGTFSDGRKVRVSYTATLDGKQVPINGDPRYSSVAIRKIDQSTYETVFYQDGKAVRTDRSVISDGGRARTITSRDAQMKVVAVSVDERQTQ